MVIDDKSSENNPPFKEQYLERWAIFAYKN